MKKLSNFIVKKRIFLLILFLLLAIGSAFLMRSVTINYDVISYLPEDSATKQGFQAMYQDFEETNSLTVMFENLNEEERESVRNRLAAIENVKEVRYEQDSESYNKDGFTRYEVLIPGNGYTELSGKVYQDICQTFSAEKPAVCGIAADNAETNRLLGIIILIALGILLCILFVMCSSWTEPFLFLLAIGAAVLMNMGTNAFLPSVSNTTYMIAAILQLVLSMDYSIMLIDRYRQEKEHEPDKEKAMEQAVSKGFLSIASSSVTTIAGLLCLLFMSFAIGRDMGIVLAKGVLISLICILFMLPALILLFDKAIEKTRKKTPVFSMKHMARFSYKGRYAILAVFVLLLAGSFLMKDYLTVEFTLPSSNKDQAKVEEVFPAGNSLVVLYEEAEEEAVQSILPAIASDSQVQALSAYGSTLGRSLTAEEMGETLNIDPALLKVIYYSSASGFSTGDITLPAFLSFLTEASEDGGLLAGMLDEQTVTQLSAASQISALAASHKSCTSEELAGLTGIDEALIRQLFGYAALVYGTPVEAMTVPDFLAFIIEQVVPSEQFSSFFSQETTAQLMLANQVALASASGQAYNSAQMAGMLQNITDSVNEDTMRLLYLYYFSVQEEEIQPMTLEAFVDFTVDQVLADPSFAPYFDETTQVSLQKAKETLEAGKKELVGEKYARMIINTNLPRESEETYAFIDSLEEELSDTLTGSYYVLGDSAMAREMNKSFTRELNWITILTAAAIFIVVWISFRSLSVPLVLVLLIQCAIYLTMGITYLQGVGVYYLALLVVQALLMGATIDYAILYTNYYRTGREFSNMQEAAEKAYSGAMTTILTSASILVIVTLVVGLIMTEPTISQVCLTIAKGSFLSTVLVIFILPGMLCALDRWVGGKKRKR